MGETTAVAAQPVEAKSAGPDRAALLGIMAMANAVVTALVVCAFFIHYRTPFPIRLQALLVGFGLVVVVILAGWWVNHRERRPAWLAGVLALALAGCVVELWILIKTWALIGIAVPVLVAIARLVAMRGKPAKPA